MGIDLIFRGNGHESCTRFSTAEWDTLARLESLLPGAVARVIGRTGAELGEEVALPVADLLAAIAQIDDLLISRPHLLPFAFMFKAEYLLLNGNRFSIDEDFVTGMRSGLELPGDPVHRYAIQAGLDECWLVKMAVGTDGDGRVVERRDLRGEEEIVTTTCGRIRIHKRNDHVGIRKELASIREFLVSLAGPEVTRTVSG